MGKNDKVLVSRLLSQAGVRIGGERPWDIQVHDERFYPRILAGGTMAMGESYMDGWWDCAALDQMVDRVLQAELDKTVRGVGSELRLALRAVILNLQGKRRAYEVGEEHYDAGNDLFKAMLDKRMNYSCGYWRNAGTLDEAQEAKLELCCRKLDLRPGMSVLDIGCGWGGFAKYAAERHGVKVTGITISKEQAAFARESCEGLPVSIAFQDYRTLEGRFDRAVSIGMIEHVGYKNYRTYMETVHDVLADDGIFLLQTIGSNSSGRNGEPWMDKYIFPNGMLPSPAHLSRASEGLFVIEDWHNFGADYDKTLMAWHRNFARNWPEISRSGLYDQRFYRMWTYYLLSCAGGFRARKNQLWQVVFAKRGVPGGYVGVRSDAGGSR
jgi:cyclopropane-fatty-acyl-phospholipid synthase